MAVEEDKQLCLDILKEVNLGFSTTYDEEDPGEFLDRNLDWSDAWGAGFVPVTEGWHNIWLELKNMEAEDGWSLLRKEFEGALGIYRKISILLENFSFDRLDDDRYSWVISLGNKYIGEKKVQRMKFSGVVGSLLAFCEEEGSSIWL